MIDPLCIVTAGAGSGKTHMIQDQLRTWVGSGAVQPERILAVTYTKAAAAELQERISGALLESGKVEAALRLSQAYISTIHSLGLRILTEFGFEAGSSPSPRLLNQDEENALIARALERTDKADRIVANLRIYGYSFNAGTGTSGEQAFRDDLLRVVRLLRSIDITAPRRMGHIVRQAKRQLVVEYGPARRDKGQTRELRRLVRALLDLFPHPLGWQSMYSKTAIKEFRADFHCLVRAARPGSLESDWDLWERLRNLRAKPGDSLPGPYLVLLGEIRRVADALVDHEGPLRQAEDHIEQLLSAARDVIASYNQAKREAGLVDYTDMIAAAGRLLRDRPDVLQTLASQIDCLVVDEFQDTNPLQFDLLWRIKQTKVPTLVVGDVKQAIMGFQGADPRLFAALERNHRSVSRPLTRNWRSSPPLMDFVNAVGTELFGTGYVQLEPQRQPARMEPLEVMHFVKRTKKDWHAIRAWSVGTHLKRLLKDSSQEVSDHRTGSWRRLRGGDIAVLCPTNEVVETYAGVFQSIGLRVNHQAAGWLSSAPVRLAWNALAYVANPGDRHAALLLCSTELGSLTLEEGVRQLIETGRIKDPILHKLEALSEGVADRTVYAVVAETLRVAELFDEVSSWPDSEQARANLVRLLDEAGQFMDANREALAHSGYHGQGVETLLSWLAFRQDEDEQPERSVLQEDAITLRTWHSAKGLEWPVVAVCNLDRALRPHLPSLDIECDSFDDLGTILEGSRISYSPRYAAAEKREEMESRLREGQLTEARRLLYVALTRARDKLLLEWPAFQARPEKGKKRTYSYWKLLRDSWRLSSSRNEIVIRDQRFPCNSIAGNTDFPSGFDPKLGRFDSDSDFHRGNPSVSLPTVGRRAIRKATPPAECTPESVAASALAGQDVRDPPGDLRSWTYGPGLDIELDLSSRDLGTFLHRCFEILGGRPALARQMEALTGVAVPPEIKARIVNAVAQFEAWLQGQFAIDSILREWPVLMLDENGTVVSGEADLIIETPDGTWVLDHKSDRITDPATAFQRYEPQLNAYARALSGEGRTVAGIGLNLIRSGSVVWRRPDLPGRPGRIRALVRNEPSGTRVP